MEEIQWKLVTAPEEYRSVVLDSHRKGNFAGDDHKMDVRFSLKKYHRGFYGALGYLDGEEDPVCFCSCETYDTNHGVMGYIRCQGVVKSHRGKGLSKLALLQAEQYALQGEPNLKKFLSTCNPVSAKAHQSCGYVVDHPGHLSKTGKLCMIKLHKDVVR